MAREYIRILIILNVQTLSSSVPGSYATYISGSFNGGAINLAYSPGTSVTLTVTGMNFPVSLSPLFRSFLLFIVHTLGSSAVGGNTVTANSLNIGANNTLTVLASSWGIIVNSNATIFGSINVQSTATFYAGLCLVCFIQNKKLILL